MQSCKKFDKKQGQNFKIEKFAQKLCEENTAKMCKSVQQIVFKTKQ